MPTYAYFCAGKHEHDVTVPVNSEKPKTSKCPACGRRAAYSIALTHRRAPALITDVQPWEMEAEYRGVVKSRRHWRELQKKHGFVDYEQVKEKSSDWMEKGAQAARLAQERNRQAAKYGGGWGENERTTRDH